MLYKPLGRKNELVGNHFLNSRTLDFHFRFILDQLRLDFVLQFRRIIRHDKVALDLIVAKEINLLHLFQIVQLLMITSKIAMTVMTQMEPLTLVLLKSALMVLTKIVMVVIIHQQQEVVAVEI